MSLAILTNLGLTLVPSAIPMTLIAVAINFATIVSAVESKVAMTERNTRSLLRPGAEVQLQSRISGIKTKIGKRPAR